MISPVEKEAIRGFLGLFIPSEIEQEILQHFSENTLIIC